MDLPVTATAGRAPDAIEERAEPLLKTRAGRISKRLLLNSQAALSGTSAPFARDVVLADRYSIVSEIGRGSMGIVYDAWDQSLGRTVAVKTLREESQRDAVRVERFRREIESISELRHPNIVSIHDVGLLDDRFWYVMDVIEGETLALHLTNGALEPRAAFKLMLPIVRAVAHAHDSGLVHRDIKPENILIDRDGSPFLTDFGLAHRLEKGTRLTATGATVGTPAFMSPEQITKPRDVDRRADIYSLGACLYECLTARLPFDDTETYAELLYAIIHREPKLPGELARSVARDAQSIVLACLQKDPGDRFSSAHELAEDMECFLRGEAVKVSLPGFGQRSMRWLRRHWSLAVGLSIGILSIGFALTTVLAQRSEFARARRITINLERERENLMRVFTRSQAEAVRRELRETQLAELALGEEPEEFAAVYARTLAADREFWPALLGRARRRAGEAGAARLEGAKERARSLAQAAIADLEAARQLAPVTAALLVFEAELKIEELHDVQGARPLLVEAGAQGKGPAAGYARARLAWLDGDDAAAAALARQALALRDLSLLRRLAATALAGSGRPSAAAELLPKERRGRESVALVRARIAIALARKPAELERADALIAEALRRDSEDPFIAELRAQLALARGDTSLAKRLLSEAPRVARILRRSKQ